MSFFNDFLESFKISDTSTKTTLSLIVGVGLMVVGKIKIMNLDNDRVVIRSNKDVLELVGNELKIKSLAKGEIVVSGNITKINLGEKYE